MDKVGVLGVQLVDNVFIEWKVLQCGIGIKILSPSGNIHLITPETSCYCSYCNFTAMLPFRDNSTSAVQSYIMDTRHAHLALIFKTTETD